MIQAEHTPQTCSGCLALALLARAEKAEAKLRDWGIEPDAEVDERFRRDIAEINQAEGRTVLTSRKRGDA